MAIEFGSSPSLKRRGDTEIGRIVSLRPRICNIDNDFRLVKTQREATQRPSYRIAVRKD